MKSLDVFALRNAVVDDYKKFATSFTTIQADDIRQQVTEIYDEGRFWPEPLIQINPAYEPAGTVAHAVAAQLLHPGCADIFNLTLHKHQHQALTIAARGESYVVTTGTGSGKSLCFFIPIVSAILKAREQDAVPRTRAIVIYPMNALANSQLEELAKFMPDRPEGKPVTFARYTGQETTEQKQAVAANPPDILLTNFMMLELLMTRQDPLDRQVMQNCEGLRFLVLDELHTYRGRQGADVAMLVRRVRERLSPDVLCIGTSATMKSDGTLDDRRRVVASVASTLFATPVPATNIIDETLERVTDRTQSVETLGSLIQQAPDLPLPQTDAELRVHPLAIWVELNLGITRTDENPKWHRARPLTLSEASERLAVASGRPKEICEASLRRLLTLAGTPEKDRVAGSESARAFFPFKLHQFLSGAGHAYATLEPPGSRRVTVERQVYLPDSAEEKRLFAVHFCRRCGQAWHPVLRTFDEDGHPVLRARDIDDAPPTTDEDEDEGDEGLGFITLRTEDLDEAFAGVDDEYPENWKEPDGRKLKREYRTRCAAALLVEPDGRIGSGTPAWFMPGHFRFCVRCDETHSGSSPDRNRLASLTAEGRSSATTVLVSSALRSLHQADALQRNARKVLAFTDNRQDAALQAGHFNDFIFVSLVRAGFLAALQAAGPGGLAPDRLGAAHFKALGFDRADRRGEWMGNPDLKGAHRLQAEAAMRDLLKYRIWFDQRRGWRFANPNLEELGLVRVEYLEEAMDELVSAPELMQGPPILAQASLDVRRRVYREIFDHLRKGLAVESTVLDPIEADTLYQRSRDHVRPPWGFQSTRDDRPISGRWLMIKAPPRRGQQHGDEDLVVRGGVRSVLGKRLRQSELWAGLAIRSLKLPEFDDLLTFLLKVATDYGFLVEAPTPFDVSGWKLKESAVIFHSAEPAPSPNRRPENPYFRDLYRTLAAMLAQADHPLFELDAREHTAQVRQEDRQIREKRFRFNKKEVDELKKDHPGQDRFLPVMVCSPTMELGVDISDLNTVYLRNVPPTPANYAQRSGRAGRSGQAALVLTYAAAQSPHDQFFFRDPPAMVHGEVRAPSLDLANRDLIESHLQAVWLASSETPLAGSIARLLDLTSAERPLLTEVSQPLDRPELRTVAVDHMTRVLALVTDLTAEKAPWYSDAEAFARSVAEAALTRFHQAFDRWRHLFSAAEGQRDAARRVLDDHTAPAQERRSARSRHDRALDQLNLLREGDEEGGNDFNTYRYLATEGFLPGYNFPRLPLMAYIPRVEAGGRHTWVQRARFLGLSEFGPRSLIYHEGRAFRVVKALLRPASAVAEAHQLATETARVCTECGAGHFDEVSVCHACQHPLGDALIRDIFRIENVETGPATRITANDEERQRQGFELQTTFQWSIRDGRHDARTATAADAQGTLLDLTYGHGARITRLNKGLRRRKNKSEYGFWINPATGFWKGAPEDGDDRSPNTTAPQRIVPCVRDHKNALLIRPRLPLALEAAATFQYALLRGIETVFQLESGELLAEPMPGREVRNGCLLYEAAEGGAGVLTRLASEPDALARVARTALRVMHFDVPETGDLPAELEDVKDARCVAGCYRCLLSYYNQPDHELINRRHPEARDLLLHLARSQVKVAQVLEPAAVFGADDPWQTQAHAHGLPVGKQVGGAMIWPDLYAAAVLTELPADERKALADRFDLVDFTDLATWPAAFATLARLLGVAP